MEKLVLLSFVMLTVLLSGCSPSSSTLVPQDSTATEAIHTSTPIITPSPVPTNTLTPTSTLDPFTPLRIPNNGDHFSTWGWEGYQVWASNISLASCGNGRGSDFTCGDTTNKATMYYWHSEQPWYFAGQAILEAQLTSTTFMFDQPYLNIVITANNSQTWSIDSIVGILEDGSEVPFGYALFDGKLVAVPLYWDSYSPIGDLKFYIDLEHQRKAPGEVKDCGVVGRTPDKSVINIYPGDYGSGTPLMFRMLNSSTDWEGFRGEQAYKLIGIKIIAGIYSFQYRMCD
jgi:hypothetical protein